MAKKRRSVPNFFTIANLMSGMLAIQFSLTGHLNWAPYCIFAAVVFDFFDGFMATILKVRSDKGKQMDSLADIVTFGVAPGFMMFALFQFIKKDVLVGYSGYNDLITFMEYFAFMIPIFALFRLAKYNVDTKQSTSFLGVPTATAAIFFASLPLLADQAVFNPSAISTWLLNNVIWNHYALILLVFVFSILMVSRMPLFALKFKHYKWAGNEIQFVFLGLSALAILGLKLWSVPVIVILYISMSIFNNVLLKTKSKK